MVASSRNAAFRKSHIWRFLRNGLDGLSHGYYGFYLGLIGRSGKIENSKCCHEDHVTFT